MSRITVVLNIKKHVLFEYTRDTSRVELETADEVFQTERTLEYHISRYSKNTTGVRLSEGRGQNNQQPTPNDNKSEWWSSSAVLVYDLHRGMCCKPSGKVQEGREGLLIGNICDW